MVPVTFFPVTSSVSETYAYFAFVLRTHYAICRYTLKLDFSSTKKQLVFQLEDVYSYCTILMFLV